MAVFTALFLFPHSVLAISAPVLINPSDTTSINVPILNWQAPSYPLFPTNPYRIQVDDDSSFISPYRDYYTSSTSYAPNLADGLWYWRVRARDSSGTTSDWSSTWSFTLSPPTPTPTPTPQSTAMPVPSSSSNPSSTFNISTDASSINSDDILTVAATTTGLDPNTRYYLKGAFIKPGSSNYFGKTLVSGNWVKNSQTYSSQFPMNTDSAGVWNGSIQVMPDPEDSGFTGSGSYIFKLGRYSASGSGPVWSNEVNINITGNHIAEPTSSPKPSSINSKISPSSNPVKSSISPKFNYPNIASIAGVSTDSSTPALVKSDIEQTLNKPKVNIWLLGAGLIVFVSGAGVLFYPKLKHKMPFRLQKTT